jgi:hypothetical protein
LPCVLFTTQGSIFLTFHISSKWSTIVIFKKSLSCILFLKHDKFMYLPCIFPRRTTNPWVYRVLSFMCTTKYFLPWSIFR